MANDPAFLFYPGDYLRDTQCLSERAQVCYDRIMCEHMRNICITQAQLNFFTKRLTDEEKTEILMVVSKTDAGFQIPWVVDSIVKRREYSDSRRKNRESKPKEKKNISSSYVPHMEIEDEIEIENKNEGKKANAEPLRNFFEPDVKGDDIIFPLDTKPVRELWAKWKEARWVNHQKAYGFYGEQAELKKLEGKSFKELEQIILNAISGKWNNLYGNGKQQTNGHSNLSKGQQQAVTNANFIKDRWGNAGNGERDS